MPLVLAAVLLVLASSPLQGQGRAASPVSLRPGDVVRVVISREPALSGDVLVDDRGRAHLPILGSRSVDGASWSAVRDSILAEYARETGASEVSVIALQRVLVLGSVTSPGVYFATLSSTIADAVALAGGATPEGDLRRLRVVRDGETLYAQVAVDSPAAQAGVRSGDQIFVERRSWFDRNSATAVSAFVGIAGVIVTLLVFR